ncbi:SCY1-like protein 2 [Amphibalanus amphitrite]|uniref:SCY1-like protein 2 n=1 Tax=Amphibalanus amphitrite TaxID=1232801 RepID=UPI001C92931E|nr:SCY1-like protein 2 [Amphibalanus amphitrite]XP_043223314.1 SCY1-like protein 2 [Amphibalanus amphitrite]XP_043223316.1 SCY1-like protein 2 [Amphibalanus amphitrite]XP_043223317.1 SCY1-like protein 2 [Amphibalanus amphitrite]XP_043223318.1 SCY1-like protein 2 [Amphibalanus amphitrite]XP_043223319.1 SCY1-like protein 2 [Amphibalanus amphitrite]
MEMLKKLQSTVAQAVTQVSGALPGNPVTREYEVKEHIASAGPGLLWKVYSAVKKSTREEASVFLLEKHLLEQWGRRDREMMLDILRQGVSQLTRLRHPRILTVQHAMEESRESLAFATEPVFASLSNVLGQLENAPSPVPAALRDHQLHQVEIKYGLLQLGQALEFLHSDVKMLHRNVCPDSVVINKSGAWKLAGFEFCQANKASADQPPSWPVAEYDPDVHPLAQPALDFMCPEAALCLAHTPYSDMYSLAALVYAVFTRGGTVFNCAADWYAYKKAMNELKRLPPSRLEPVPAELRETVKLMLNVAPDLRPDAHQFAKINYFDDVGVKTLNYLDSLFQWDNLQKSQFYKGLPQIIPKLPHRVCLYRVLPSLAKEFVNPAMIPFVLPNTMLIAENSSKEEYVEHIMPLIAPVMKLQEPVQILLIFMQRLELLLSKTPADAVRAHVLPLMYRALESNTQQIQELCLSVIPKVGALVDYPSMKNALLPRVKQLCLSTGYLSTRVGCLVCLGKLLPHLDRWLVLDEVLPLLPQVPTREPAVIMAVIGIYKVTLSSDKLGMTKEVMATKVLPFLLPLAIENGLAVAQFDAVMTLVKDLLARVETEHRDKLTQLNAMKDEQQKALNASLAQPPPGQLVGAPGPTSDIDKMFGELGIGGDPSPAPAPIPARSPSGPLANGSSPAGGGASLSLEEKQRRARQQEAAARLSSQPALTSPTTTSSANSSSGSAGRRPPRDLTDSLISSNLNMMARPAAPPAAFPSAAPNYRPGGGAFQSQQPQQQPMFQQQGFQQQSGFQSAGFQQQQQFGMGGPMIGAPGFGRPALMPAPSATGWSQPVPSAGLTPQYNSQQMGLGPQFGQQAGLRPQYGQQSGLTPQYGQQPASKQLSSSEISDLLS